MVCEEFLKNIGNAAVLLGFMVAVDSIAANTMNKNSISVLLGYARLTAAIVIAQSLKKMIIKNTLEEDEDIEEDGDYSDDGGRCDS